VYSLILNEIIEKLNKRYNVIKKPSITMTVAKESQDPRKLNNNTYSEDIILPQSDLWSDEPPLESDEHRDEIELLLECIKWHWRERNDFYASGNLTIYFNKKRLKTRDLRGPDFFVVKGCENYSRKSWVLWEEENKYPNVIIELLSDSTARVDRGIKKRIYQNTFKTPEYFWFHPYTLEFKGFLLKDNKYEPLSANQSGWLWSQELELFLGIYESKLRFFSRDNQLILTDKERAEVAQQRAEAAQIQAEAAQQQAETERLEKEAAQKQVEELKRRLKALDIDPDMPL
jgi:Uma2 family endonuclease